MKKILVLVLSCAMLMVIGTTAFAIDNIGKVTVEDNAPVIGNYIYNAEREAIAKEKELAAQRYYDAKLRRSPISDQYLKVYAKNKDIISNLKNGTPSLFAVSKRLDIFQKPQETDFWCGYAAAKSLLDYEGIEKTQETIADEIYSVDVACPWYLSNGDSRDQFPVPVYLTDETGFYYIAYPSGAAGGTAITGDDIDHKIIATIDSGHGVMTCGQSRGDIPGHKSILPGYPAYKIGHWLAIDGYKDNGQNIWIVDPAKSDEVSWSDNITAYYSISVDKLAAYCQVRGIVY